MASKKPDQEREIQTQDAAAATVENQESAQASTAAEVAKARAAAPKFKVVRRVTLAQLKMKAEHPYYLKFIEKIVQSEPAKDAKGNLVKTDMEPPMISQVIDLTTGEAMQIICNAVMVSEFAKLYPDDAYVGKSFEIIRHEKATGKRYATYSIAEIEVE